MGTHKNMVNCWDNLTIKEQIEIINCIKHNL